MKLDLDGVVRDEIADLQSVMHKLDAKFIESIEASAQLMYDALGIGGTIFCIGNGGSSSEAAHLATELMGRFRRSRRPHAAVDLAGSPALLTALGNDFGFVEVFERQLRGLCGPGDVVVAFSTSGASPNIVRGLAAANSIGATTILATGTSGPSNSADVTVRVPSTSTARIQEIHTLVVHLWSALIDGDVSTFRGPA